MFIAHIREVDGKEQTILEHLTGTEELCRKFAGAFHNGNFAAYCGRLHDIGKYSEEFQKRIRGDGKRCDHSTAGAKIAYNIQLFGKLAAYCIAGHHGGLPNAGTKTDYGADGTLFGRMSKGYEIPNYQRYENEIDISDIIFRPSLKISPNENAGFSFALFVRMIYSCLTDADYTNTARFMNPHSASLRVSVDFNMLLEKLNKKLSEFQGTTGIVNEKRAQILKDCIASASSDKGLFTLTVPTGGGKTLSSMAFALNHLVKNKMSRIIYVIPYTSIIEQNAKIFSDVLGSGNILEHHSNYDFESSDDDSNDIKRLAAENWDMPIVVTTNVQFFESLFSNKPSKCRKLHNIANSVIIFDEAQMIPVPYLKACVNTISELVKNYECSAVLCSATQPSLNSIFPCEMNPVEICSNTGELYTVFKRTEIIPRGIIPSDELAGEINASHQCLVIVNTRKHALKLYSMMSGENIYHLSTLMCPAHRKKVIHEIKEKLNANLPCKVVSTQLIEAGVDVDFPVVFRAQCGLDSLVQSAGRCNREGRLRDEDGNKILGKVHWFRPEDEFYKNQPQTLELPIRVANEVGRMFEDKTSPEAIKDYFERLYAYNGKSGLDMKGIVEEMEKGLSASGASYEALFNYNFKSIAEKFKLIDDSTFSLIVPYNEEAKKLIRRLEYADELKHILRSLQQYTVNIYSREYEALVGVGKVRVISENTAVLTAADEYDDNTGIKIDIRTGIGVFY